MKKAFIFLLILMLLCLSAGCTDTGGSADGQKSPAVSPPASAGQTGAATNTPLISPAVTTPGAGASALPSGESAPPSGESAPPSASAGSAKESDKNRQDLKKEVEELKDELEELENLFSDVDFEGIDEF